MTVSAIVIGCLDHHDIHAQVERLREQTHSPDEFNVMFCCRDFFDPYVANSVRVEHQSDWGHAMCDLGLSFATMDYTCFVNSDDAYQSTFFEEMLKTPQFDLVYCDYTSHLVGGKIVHSEARVGYITRGSFVVRTSLAQDIGYRHRVYEADGLFVEDIVKAGASTAHIPRVLMHHK